jgi:hypothetical protein
MFDFDICIEAVIVGSLQLAVGCVQIFTIALRLEHSKIALLFNPHRQLPTANFELSQ